MARARVVLPLSALQAGPAPILPILFRPLTTRKYYPGEHAIEPKINGKGFGRVGSVAC